MKHKTLTAHLSERVLIGWNEWVALPNLNIPAIKAKIDTGAKTSALHAFDIKKIVKQRKEYVSFQIHPLQNNNITTIVCEAPLLDERYIMSSNGHKELRYVIQTTLVLGSISWLIDVTLSNRDPLKFRMLIGRDALGDHVLIDPHHCLYQGKIPASLLRNLYNQSN